MNLPSILPRFAARELTQALTDTPVVLVHGPRQSGKTTLTRLVGGPLGYTYLTFDDPAVLSVAKDDPSGFIADLPEKVILDEVQKAPALFSSIKLSVDRNRKPGRFLLTGSANVLLVPHLSDSLAGRMEILRLHPLSQCELSGFESHFLDRLFQADFKLHTTQRLGLELAERIVAGGFPPALARGSASRRSAWYRDYLATLVERDVRDLSRISSLDALPRLLALAASQTARLLNVTTLAAPFGMARQTIRDYLTLLERVFLIDELPSWPTNQMSRLIKTPKLHMGDTGLACALLDQDAAGLWQDRAARGQHLETFVFQELRRQADWGAGHPVLPLSGQGPGGSRHCGRAGRCRSGGNRGEGLRYGDRHGLPRPAPAEGSQRKPVQGRHRPVRRRDLPGLRGQAFRGPDPHALGKTLNPWVMNFPPILYRHRYLYTILSWLGD